MSDTINAVTPSGGMTATIFVAMELSGSSWIVAIDSPGSPGKVGLHKLKAGDVPGMMGKIERERHALETAHGMMPRVLLTYEAGFEGFWLARVLDDWQPRVEVCVCDPASLEVVRKAKKVKTDRIDAKRMIRALRAWDRGDKDSLSRVRIPSVEEEDGKRLLRRRDRLVTEQTRHSNVIRGLLRLQGITHLEPRSRSFEEDLESTGTALGTPLGQGLLQEIRETHARLALVMAQLASVEAEKKALVAASAAALATNTTAPPGERAALCGTSPSKEAGDPMVALLVQLKGIGANDALLLARELFYREINNRRELASLAGLAPVPWASGKVDHDQGISKAGSPMVRKQLVQMAWRWLRFQPDSDLAKWFHGYCSARDSRARKRGIVALARKLLVALWRYATTGLVPTGAVVAI